MILLLRDDVDSALFLLDRMPVRVFPAEDLLTLVAKYRKDKTFDRETWNKIKVAYFSSSAFAFLDLMLLLECAWYYGEKELCHRKAKATLLEPTLRLPTNRYHQYLLEEILQDRVPYFLPIRKKLEIDSRFWIESGRKETGLLFGYPLFAAQCWRGSLGAKRDGYIQDITHLVEASFTAIYGEDGGLAQLRERELCSCCGETYKLENLSICASCAKFYCYRWNCGYGVHANGNVKCSCGGEVVG